MGEADRIKAVIVGAGQEGLETLNILRRDKVISFLMLLDPDKDAIGFRLEEYGYTYADDLNLRLSHRMRDLTIPRDIDLIIDTAPDRHHRDLYDLNIHLSEIINGHAARFIWELKYIEDIEKRRAQIAERIGSIVEAIDLGLQPAPQAPHIDEHCALMLRSSFLGSHATSARLTIFGKASLALSEAKNGPCEIIQDINIDPALLIKKEGRRQSIKDPAEEDKIIRAVVAFFASLNASDASEAKNEVENRSPWGGGRWVVKGWDALTVIPIMADSDLLGVLWLFYATPKEDFVKNDISFISSIIPLSVKALRGAIEREQSRLTSIEEALSSEPLNIIRSDSPIRTKLREVNNAIYKLLKAEDSHLYIKDPATGDLVLQASTYKLPSLSGRIRIRKGEGVIGEVFERSRPLILMEGGLSNNELRQRFARSEDTIALLYLPLIVKDKGVGIMSMEFTNIHNLTPGIYKSLSDTGTQLANAISSDVERYQMSQKIIKLSAVNEEGIELLSTTDLQKVLALSASSSAMLLDAGVSVLRVSEEGRLAVNSTYGIHEYGEGKIEQALLDLDNNITTMVSQTKIPVLIHDILEYAEEPPAQDFPYKTAIVVPILLNKELIGTLSLYNKQAPEAFSSIFFTEDDREIIEYFTQYVARGVVNAKRYSERQSLITIDEVTGLRNERYLQMRFPEEIKRAKRYGRSVSLIFFEVKPFDNDMVRDVAMLVRETFRYIDVLVRLKDSKFAALLPDTGEGVKDAVKRLTRGFNQLKERMPDLTLYAGYSTYPFDSEDMHELIKKASRLQQY